MSGTVKIPLHIAPLVRDDLTLSYTTHGETVMNLPDRVDEILQAHPRFVVLADALRTTDEAVKAREDAILPNEPMLLHALRHNAAGRIKGCIGWYDFDDGDGPGPIPAPEWVAFLTILAQHDPVRPDDCDDLFTIAVPNALLARTRNLLTDAVLSWPKPTIGTDDMTEAHEKFERAILHVADFLRQLARPSEQHEAVELYGERDVLVPALLASHSMVGLTVSLTEAGVPA